MSVSEHNVGPVDIGNSAKQDQKDDPDDSSQSMMEEVFWRTRLEISNAKSRKIRGSNFVQLATVDAQSNEPRCRCVVMRGFLNLPKDHTTSVCSVPPFWSSDSNQSHTPLSCVLQMCTDQRSQKVTQCRTAELLWWFPKSSEQYRIRGELLYVGGGVFAHDHDINLATARKQLWGNLSDSARESFLDPNPPGVAYQQPLSKSTGGNTNVVPTGGRTADGKVMPPPDDFLLMLLIPNHCDYLRLTNMYRQVDQAHETGWTLQRLNP